jgi:hypothetical protein
METNVMEAPVTETVTAKRGPGRPVNPDSKRQKEIRRKAAEAAAKAEQAQ